jgi:CheY-like chemotaxis protein
MLLSKQGIQADLFTDGKDCVDFFEKNPNHYNLIFMDNMMPIMNGTEATKILRSNGFEGIIIGLTGKKNKYQYT